MADKRNSNTNTNKTAEDKIHSFLKFGVKLGMERMQALCDKLGNPQEKLNVIHVAGTNGKGSVCRYIYEVLSSNNYSCGVYCSPFVSDFRERIEACGEMISREELERSTEKVVSAVDAILSEGGESPTEFEVLTAVAFDFFASRDLDFVILEVGLGGIGDSTNIIKEPMISVITSISMDHTDVLGDTIEKIAGEKAGIIKKGIPVVSSTRGDASIVIARKAYEMGSPLIDASKIVDSVRSIDYKSIYSLAFSVLISGVRYDGIELSMVGKHQIENAVCALVALENLRNRKLIKLNLNDVKEGMKNARLPARFDVKEGMKNARLPARFEVINCLEHSKNENLGPSCTEMELAKDITEKEFNNEATEKEFSNEATEKGSNSIPIILDGAHNEAGAASLKETIEKMLPDSKILSIVGALRDKDVSAIIKAVSSFSETIFLTEIQNPRSCTSEELREILLKVDENRDEELVILNNNPLAALTIAREYAKKNDYDAVVVCGSLYLIGEIRNSIKE